ncbi:MAG TPA: TraR/DksA C4-type zinc finger protein [Anaeromyxobacteraceae bacterium]
MRKQELVRYRKELVAQLSTLARHGAATAQELADSGEELPDPADRATRESDLEGELRLRDRDRERATCIQQALARIDAGTFGRCATCGEPIGSARLRARPETELCIDCMRDTERRAS